MKTLGVLITVAFATHGAAVAETNAPPATPVPPPVQWTMDAPPAGETAMTHEDAWMESQQGVVGQFLKAPNPLAPLNPLAPVWPELKESTLNRDTMTGRVMGLTLVRWEF